MASRDQSLLVDDGVKRCGDHSQMELGERSREGDVRKVAGELFLLRGLNDEHIFHDRCILVLCVRAEEPEESCVVDDMS